MKVLKGLKHSIEAEGFHLEERFFSDDTFVDNLGDSLVRIFESLDGLEASCYPGTVHFLLGRDPAFLTLLEDRRMHEIAREVVGNDIRLHSYNGLVVEPDSLMVQQEIHRDGKACGDCGRLEGFQILIFLDDYIKDNGAIRVLKKNKNYLEEPTLDEFENDSVVIEGPAGSVLFFEAGIWHASGQNFSEKARRSITLVYFKGNVSPQIDFCEALDDDFKSALPADIKSLIGLDNNVPKNVGEFYLNAKKKDMGGYENE